MTANAKTDDDRRKLDEAVFAVTSAVDSASPAPRPPKRARAVITGMIEESGKNAYEELGKAQKKLTELEAQLAAVEAGSIVLEIEPDRIIDSNWRDRDPRAFADAAFEDLVRSIEEHGQITPIEVRPSRTKPDKYELIFGHRRHRACLRLGRKVRAIVRDAEDRQLVMRMEIENTKRKPLSAIEAARKFNSWLEAKLMTRQEICDSLGYTRAYMSQVLSLLSIPKEVLEALGDEREMSLRQGIRLAGALRDPEARQRAIARAPEIAASRQPLERRIALFCAPDAPRRSGRIADLKDPFGRTNATLAREDGRLVVRFHSSVDEELVRLWWARLEEMQTAFFREKAGIPSSRG